MVTVPLPAVIVPLTLVVLHPGPVQTEIASALAVPLEARLTIPKTASASSNFLKSVNEGISNLLPSFDKTMWVLRLKPVWKAQVFLLVHHQWTVLRFLSPTSYSDRKDRSLLLLKPPASCTGQSDETSTEQKHAGWLGHWSRSS